MQDHVTTPLEKRTFRSQYDLFYQLLIDWNNKMNKVQNTTTSPAEAGGAMETINSLEAFPPIIISALIVGHLMLNRAFQAKHHWWLRIARERLPDLSRSSNMQGPKPFDEETKWCEFPSQRRRHTHFTHSFPLNFSKTYRHWLVSAYRRKKCVTR